MTGKRVDHLRKALLRGILFTLLLAVLVSGSFAENISSSDKADWYNAAVMQLETYIESLSHNSEELEGIRDTFDKLGGYSMSMHFGYYISALAKIDNAEFDFELDEPPGGGKWMN